MNPNISLLMRWGLIPFLGIVLTAHPAAPQTPKRAGASTALIKELGAIVATAERAPAFVGVKVKRLDNGRTVFEHQPRHLFRPASNQKLITSIAALELLPSTFAFRTTIFADGPIEMGELKGDLIIRGTGDPLLEPQHLDTLARRLAESGLQHVRGNLVGDVSWFDTLSWGAGWLWDDEPESFQPFLTPLTVHRNVVDVITSPGVAPGLPAIVRIEPPAQELDLTSLALTAVPSGQCTLVVTRERATNRVTVSGTIGAGCDPDTSSLSIRNPAQSFLSLFLKKLNDHGIVCAGHLSVDTLTRGTELTSISHPIDSVIALVNKESDNLAAEHLLKTISASARGTSGSASDAALRIRAWLAHIGIDTNLVFIADGSGLSQNNLTAPEAIVELLQFVHGHSETYNRLFASLAIGGIDGTLAKRMRSSKSRGNAHAKTGTMTAVSSLSGYVRSRDGVLLAYSIMANNFAGKAKRSKELEDRIIGLLANSRLSGK